ncbi:magnesium chelatase domain-containing protein [Streptomyces sp. NPDC051104]|uniref:magnesium chelatase domain-containing protein n=1 Tax=Streptomyces sp. NPDC051104 TaxID=3155044 RepID=UPI00343FDB1A
MTQVLHTDPTTADLSAACEEARQIALSARATYLQGTIAYAARLIREALPDAAAITVDTEDGELYEVRDAGGKALYRAPFTPASPLHDSITGDVEALFREVLPFGGLEDAGWETAAEGLPYRTVLLPGAPKPERRTAHGFAATPGRMLDVRAECVAGERAFNLEGPHPLYQRETRDRIRAAMANSGYDVPDAALTVTAHGTLARGATAADLALAVTALAATGAFDPRALHKVAFIGELGLDGRVRPVADVNAAVRTAYASGYTTAVVADDDMGNVDVAGIGIHGVDSLRQALVLMECFGRAN